MHLKTECSKWKGVIGVSNQWSRSPALEVCTEYDNPTEGPGATGRAPQDCVNQCPADIPPWFPYVKSPNLNRQLLFRLLKHYVEGAVGLPSSLLPQQSVWWEMWLKEQTGKPNTCQAPSHSSVARRSIKMSLSLSCWWLDYPVHWLLVIKKSKYHFCMALAFLWPFSNNNRLNIKRQKSLLGSLTSAKENE